MSGAADRGAATLVGATRSKARPKAELNAREHGTWTEIIRWFLSVLFPTHYYLVMLALALAPKVTITECAAIYFL